MFRAMTKWLKRLLVAVACLLAALIVAAAVGWSMLRGRPDWYAEQAADPAAQAAAAARAEDEVRRTIDWAASQQAEERRLGHTPPATSPATTQSGSPAARPDRSLTVRFTQQELNAAFRKWESVYRWDEKYGDYLADPRIALHGGRVIFAGVVKEMGTVVSLHFEPRMQPDGRARFDLVRVLGGKLPLPKSSFDKHREQLEDRVRSALPALQQGARIAPDGSANDKAVAATMSKLLLRVLAGEPDEAVLFLTANQGTRVPVKLTDVKIEGRSISLTVGLLDIRERAALLNRIREPYLPTGGAPTAGDAPAWP